MIVFTAPKGMTLCCEWANKTIAVFPQDQKKTDAFITLFARPEEKPQKGTISWPGEYDIQGIAIRGIGHRGGAQVSYAVEMEEIRCGFLSSPLESWSDYELELLGDIDVLVVPTDKPAIVQKLVDEIDPRILIPVQNGDADTFGEVLNYCGAKGQEEVEEFKMKALPVEGRTVVVFKRS